MRLHYRELFQWALVTITTIALSTGCQNMAEEEYEDSNYFTVDTLKKLVVFHTNNRPKFIESSTPYEDYFDLICIAAYTDKKTTTVDTLDIVGNFVETGERYVSRGAASKDVTGAFIFYANQWEFVLGNATSEMNTAALNQGMAFSQTMVIHNGNDVCPYNIRPLSKRQVHRCLCELNNNLVIIQSLTAMDYHTFVAEMLKIGVTEAINLNMGTNYDFMIYQDNDYNQILYSPVKTPYLSNFLFF